KAYLQTRWAQGTHNVKQLVAELRERGYRQGTTIVYDYLRSLRHLPRWQEAGTSQENSRTQTASSSSLSARQAAWLFTRNPRKLRLTQVKKLDHVRRASEEMEMVYQLAQDFRAMVTQRQEMHWGRWLKETQESGVTLGRRYPA